MKKIKLLNMRKSQGITQERMADKLAITVSTYCRKEAGKVKLRPEEWMKIADFLNVPIDDVYESDEGHIILRKNMTNFLFKRISNPSCSQCSLVMHDENIRCIENEIISIKSKLNQIMQAQNTSAFPSK